MFEEMKMRGENRREREDDLAAQLQQNSGALLEKAPTTWKSAC
jgi:hypothetical protein